MAAPGLQIDFARVGGDLFVGFELHRFRREGHAFPRRLGGMAHGTATLNHVTGLGKMGIADELLLHG